MTRWFRFYDDAINDPKILKLSDNLHRVWIGILCAASKNNGELLPLEDLALVVRMKPERLRAALESLMKSGLIDEVGAVLKPHNWDKRQYKSDVSTERVKRFRNVSKPVSETAPETEQIQRQITEQKEGGGVIAPPPEKPSRRKAVRGMPDIFPMSDAMRAHAERRGYKFEIPPCFAFNKTRPGPAQAMFDEFKNYHAAKGSQFADWDAAWRKWVDNQAKWDTERGKPPGLRPAI